MRLRKESTLGPKAPPCHRKRQRGFTLVELIIVMFVIFVIAAIAIPNMLKAIDNARLARCVGDIRTIGNEVNAAGMTTGHFPTMLTEVGYADLHDPWGNPYVYANLSDPANSGHGRADRFNVQINNNFDLYSQGKDKTSSGPITAAASADDIIWANDGAWIGLAAQF